MTLSSYGKIQWLTIAIVGWVVFVVCLALHWQISAALVFLSTIALLLFFRDPIRRIPSQRNVMVAPADGKISSVHEVAHYEPFGEGARCIRIFLSVLDVHVNRSPCHGKVTQITRKDGEYLNALNPRSAQVNASNLIVLHHPTTGRLVAAVRQVAGLIARHCVCAVNEGTILQRGDRFGIIMFGSTAELYLPLSTDPQVSVSVGQRVRGGETILAQVTPAADPSVKIQTHEADESQTAEPTDEPTDAPAAAPEDAGASVRPATLP